MGSKLPPASPGSHDAQPEEAWFSRKIQGDASGRYGAGGGRGQTPVASPGQVLQPDVEGAARGFLVPTPGLGRAVACVWHEHGSCRGSERALRSSPRGSHAVILHLLRGSQRPGPEAVLPRGTSSGRRAGAAAPGGPARQGTCHPPPSSLITGQTRGRLKPGNRRQRYPSRLRVYKVAAGAMKGQSSGLKNTVAAHIRRYSSTALENEGGGDF